VRHRLAAMAITGVVAAMAAGCGDDGGGGAASELEEQVAAVVADGAEDVGVRLETLGVTVERSELESVEGDDLRCPAVDAPDPGDRATCTLSLDAAEVLVDVEFGDDGGVTVVGIEVQELADGDPDVEGAVAGLVAERLGGGTGEVVARCPGVGDPQPGDTVRCGIEAGGGASTPVDFSVDDDGTLVLESAVLDRAGVEDFLVEELEDDADGAVEVDCGVEAVLVAPVGGLLTCEALRVADDVDFDVTVEVVSADGELAYEVSGR
jgi:hypothetical protein